MLESIGAEDKVVTILQATFLKAFFNEKLCIPKGTIKKKSSLVEVNRHQTSTWTIDNQDLWHQHKAFLCHTGLIDKNSFRNFDWLQLFGNVDIY